MLGGLLLGALMGGVSGAMGGGGLKGAAKGAISGAMGGAFGGAGGGMMGGLGGGGGMMSSLFGGLMQNLPGMMGGGAQGSGVDRSILQLGTQRAQTKSLQMQSMMMSRARSSIGTATALLAGGGFRGGVGSQTALYDQSMMNLARDISAQKYETRYGELMSGIEQSQQRLAEEQQASPLSSSLFETLVKPLASKGLSALGGMMGGLGGGSVSTAKTAKFGSNMFMGGMKGSDLFNEYKGGSGKSLYRNPKSNLSQMMGMF